MEIRCQLSAETFRQVAVVLGLRFAYGPAEVLLGQEQLDVVQFDGIVDVCQFLFGPVSVQHPDGPAEMKGSA